jgi:pyrroline-5-carboxylate reductase
LWYLLTFQEALFEAAARQNLEEEKQNQLRWQVKCGDMSMTTKSKAEVLAARQDTYKEYLVCALY